MLISCFLLQVLLWRHTLVSAVAMTTGERADGSNPTACASKSTCPARCQCETGEQHEEEASISCERAGLMSVPHDVPCDVRSMFLRGNALRMLPPGALPPLLFLRRLSLAHNNLTFIAPDAFQGVPALLWLSLSHNNDLGILHARALSGLQVLQTLILAACRLHDLPQRLFAPTHGLTHLHLWDNRLRRIPGALRILSRLTHLYLEDNAIEVVASSSLLGLENLTLLDLQDNYISVIHEEAFISCNKLTSLNLANNHLSSLPANAFHGLNQLQVLNLGGNQLLEVPQACLFGLASLHTLHLEHNRVKEFPPAVYDALPLLHTLHLQGNWLSSLSPPNSITATALRTLYLFDNPWHCDCNLFWLLQSATAHSQHPPYGAAARDVRCTSPEVVVGFLLPLLDFSGCFNTHANFTNIHKEPPNPISPARTLMPGHDVFTGMVQRLLLERAKSVPEPNTNAPPNSVIRQSTHFGSIVLMVVVIWRF